MGGRLMYCHDQWIERRAAVESYARHAGSIVSAAADCAAQLAEESLSDRLSELMSQMRRQEALKEELLADLQSAKEHGETLVSNINIRSRLQGDRFSDAIAVRRVLRRVADAESKFNRAWAERWQGPVTRHLAAVTLAEEAERVAAALKERMADPPEADIKEAERLLNEANSLLAKAAAIERPDVASKLSEVCRQAESDTERRRLMQQRNAELADLARRTEDWASIGMDILGRSDVGLDELDELLRHQPSLSNLDTLSDLMAPPALRTKLTTLASQAHTLGATLARQRDDLKRCRQKLAYALTSEDTQTGEDDAEATIMPGSAGNGEADDNGSGITTDAAAAVEAAIRKQNPVLKELIDTERRYVEDLQRVWDVVSTDESPPAELAGDACELLANWPDLLAFHRDCLLPELLTADSEADVAECFQRHCDQLQVYQQYCLNKPAADSLLARLGRNHPFLQRCETRLHLSDEASGGSALLPLSAYLLKPVQRVQKYQLLLAEMQRSCPQQRAALGKAVESLLAALSVLNDSMALAEVEGLRRSVLSELGRVLLHGDFQVIEDGKLLPSNKTRRVYLFSCGLLVCKRISSGGQQQQQQQQKVRYTPP
ncbi:hypothetical protein BOX15_Mlig008194g2 [Macrostomum lignano]|uniref:DH domain-containing protein n=1 Tax=Macrostomum lignano TaxID=282301 RepID=A0A267FYI5_9PLAT|nr:hypothetical protein BOX15_Mlig008194g2 [Macrostomum lignano]